MTSELCDRSCAKTKRGLDLITTFFPEKERKSPDGVCTKVKRDVNVTYRFFLLSAVEAAGLAAKVAYMTSNKIRIGCLIHDDVPCSRDPLAPVITMARLRGREINCDFGRRPESAMNLDLESELNRVIRRVPGYAHGAVKVAQIKLPYFDSGVCSDKDAAAKLFRLYPHWKHCNGKLFVFDDTTGLWGSDEYMHQAIISRYSTNLVVANDDDDFDPDGKSYGNTLSLMIRLPSFLKLLCGDRDWVKDSSKSSIGKLLFKDGVYDGVAKTFLDVRHHPFDPAVVFYGRINKDFPRDVDPTYIEDIHKRIFRDPLDIEQGVLFLHHLSRGLFGDGIEMGVMLFGIGFSKTGKGTITATMLRSCGDYCAPFHAENLKHRTNGGGDEGQNQRWMLLLQHKRLIISNECDSKCDLSGNAIKKMCGREDTLIGRQHHGNETKFLPSFMAVVLANDLPAITPFDDAVDNRVHVCNFGKIFVDFSTSEMELLSDPHIKKEIDSRLFQDAFLMLLINSYSTITPTPPAAMKAAKASWFNVDEESIMAKFLAVFVITNTESNFVSNESFTHWLKSKNAAVSLNKLNGELKRHLGSVPVDQRNRVEAKIKKVDGAARRGWVGIKRTDDEFQFLKIISPPAHVMLACSEMSQKPAFFKCACGTKNSVFWIENPWFSMCCEVLFPEKALF